MRAFTLGRSSRPTYEFMGILIDEGASHLIDLRDENKYRPSSSREKNLNAYMRANGIKRIVGLERIFSVSDPYLLDRLQSGASVSYVNGKSRYDVSELMEAVWGQMDRGRKPTLAIIGGDREPSGCIRSVWISKGLSNEGVEVRHIIDRERAIGHEAMEKWLMTRYGEPLSGARAYCDARFMRAAYEMHAKYLVKTAVTGRR
ncbi:MAG TPA: hypothetical protein PKK63_05735 [Bacillota bacterium]|nr:hypothetical protein [Bacillota bacterium]